MQKREDTPIRIMRRKYEEINKEKREAAHKAWATRISRELYDEIDEFLTKHEIKKVELIYAGYQALQNQYDPKIE